MPDSDDRSRGHGGVADGGIFKIDGTDPFAAGF